MSHILVIVTIFEIWLVQEVPTVVIFMKILNKCSIL